MSLKEIYCQDKAVSILHSAFAAGKVPHAYIFAGQDGVGKFKTAGQWAKLLLCKNPVAENEFSDSCGRCQSCGLFEHGSHPDFAHIYKELREFTRDGKGKAAPIDLPIDVVREFLIAKVPTRPTVSKRKVFVVSEAEKLNIASQNCLLKVLEEPPEFCCIILLCSRAEMLLPTTKSRCQMVRFGLIDEARIIEKLRQIGVEQEKARYLSRLARGSLGLACRWAGLEAEDADFYKVKKELINCIAGSEYGDCLSVAARFLEEAKKIAAAWSKLNEAASKTDINRRAAKTLIVVVISALYDAMRLNVLPQEPIINFDQKELMKKLAERFDCEQAAEKIADAYETMRWVDASVNEKLIFEQLLLNLAVYDKM